jgi:hypothetical protein
MRMSTQRMARRIDPPDRAEPSGKVAGGHSVGFGDAAGALRPLGVAEKP